MLHAIDNSGVRDALLKVVEMQATLMAALCDRNSSAAKLSAQWLRNAWQGIDSGIDLAFARRFIGNKTGPRSVAMKVMAAAQPADKSEMLAVWSSQSGFAGLYDDLRAGHGVRSIDNTREPFLSMSALLVAFYEEWLKPAQGFPFADGTLSREVINAAFHPLRVCPYCDGTVRTSQLDHILPKSSFPCLSCHPDNLVPVCGGCNSVQIKGVNAPLSPTEPQMAQDWFHPFLRSGDRMVQALPVRQQDRTLSLTLTASTAENQRRAANLDSLLALSSFWGRDLVGDIRRLPERAQRGLRGTTMTQASLADFYIDASLSAENWRGSDALSIYNEGLYRFASRDGDLLRDILRQCEENERAQRENRQIATSAPT